jgi:hypothetical protein
MRQQARTRRGAEKSTAIASPRLAQIGGLQRTRAQYNVLGLTPYHPGVPTSTAIGGAPAIDGYGHTYWLTKSGDIYVNNRANSLGPQFAFNLGAQAGRSADTFPDTNITIFANGTHSVGYAVSAEGYFYVIDLGNSAVTTSYLGAAASNPPGYVPAPFIDNAKTTATTNTVYVVINASLHRLVVNYQTKLIQSTGSLTLRFNRWLGFPSNVSFERYFSSPIVFNDHLVIASEMRPMAGGLRRGFFYYYDLTNHDWSSVTAPLPTVEHAFSGPGFLSSPSMDIDPSNGFKPTWAFVPCGATVKFFDLQGSGQSAETPPLVVNPTDGLSGHPSGNFSYSYPLPDPSIRNQVMIGPDWSAYVLNTNAIWKINYGSPTYGNSMAHANGANFAERAANVADSSKTWFTRTHLGQSVGSVNGSEYIFNTTQMTWDPDMDHIYALDSTGSSYTSNQVSLTRFKTNATAPGLAPDYKEGYVLSGSGQTTEFPGFALAGDWGASPFQILFSTSANLNSQVNPGNHSSIWVFTK